MEHLLRRRANQVHFSPDSIRKLPRRKRSSGWWGQHRAITITTDGGLALFSMQAPLKRILRHVTHISKWEDWYNVKFSRAIAKDRYNLIQVPSIMRGPLHLRRKSNGQHASGCCLGPRSSAVALLPLYFCDVLYTMVFLSQIRMRTCQSFFAAILLNFIYSWSSMPFPLGLL